MNKESLREKYKDIRKNIKNHKARSEEVCELILKSPYYNQYSNIAFYFPIKTEVDIKKLILKAIEEGKKVFLPKVLNGEEMDFFVISSLNDLTNGAYSIMEPITSDTSNLKQKPEVVFTPLLVVDKNLNRIGYGKGFYDRYFIKNSSVLKIGIAFIEQLIDEEIIANEFDVKLDNLIVG